MLNLGIKLSQFLGLLIFYRSKTGKYKLKIAYLYALAHFFKAIGQLGYKLHFNIEIYGQVGVLVRRVYRPADEEVNIGRFLKKQAADKRRAVFFNAPLRIAFVIL